MMGAMIYPSASLGCKESIICYINKPHTQMANGKWHTPQVCAICFTLSSVVVHGHASVSYHLL